MRESERTRSDELASPAPRRDESSWLLGVYGLKREFFCRKITTVTVQNCYDYGLLLKYYFFIDMRVVSLSTKYTLMYFET